MKALRDEYLFAYWCTETTKQTLLAGSSGAPAFEIETEYTVEW